MNLVVFKSARKNQKKIKEKRKFLRKTSFRPNRFFYMVVIQKLITTTEIFDFFLEIISRSSNIDKNLRVENLTIIMKELELQCIQAIKI
ncbi:Uncharacterized protein FWK35_00032111 [Aphis craccivora]|uniref:Uncharacterized protein n=1 Tax=Aphis craccivora TaxID=307492 RepID=A0A6G0WL93_APHCR|nr:Uncharacterized protein FWK35_00032111 [Aphis craccivora]